MDRGKTNRWRLLLAWALAFALIIGNLFLHKPLSNLCDTLYALIGRIAYERIALLAIVAIGTAAAVPLALRNRRAFLRPPALVRLAILAAVTVAAQELLLVSNIELVHFPQFAILAAAFLAAGLPPEAAWLAASAAGVFDETYQHLVIYAGVPNTYLDFNDMLLNAIGAAWTVMLWAVASSPRLASVTAGASRAWRRWVVALAALAAAVLWWHSPPVFTPLFRRAATGRFYRVLSAPEGIAAIGFVWLLVFGTVRASLAAGKYPVAADEPLDGGPALEQPNSPT